MLSLKGRNIKAADRQDAFTSKMDVQKDKITLRARVVGMIEAGMKQIDVVKHLKVSKNMVSRWWMRYSNGESLEDKPKSRRPTTVSRVPKIILAKTKGKRRTP